MITSRTTPQVPANDALEDDEARLLSLLVPSPKPILEPLWDIPITSWC